MKTIISSKTKLGLALGLFLLITISAFAALNASEKKLLGSWKHSAGTITFNSDRTISGESSGKSFKGEGQWKINGDHLNFEMTHNGQEFFASYKLKWVSDRTIKLKCVESIIDGEAGTCDKYWYTFNKAD